MKINKKYLVSSILVVGIAAISYAAAPNGGYLPGQTLEPDCNPGDANCFIQIKTNFIPGQVIYALKGSDFEGWIKLDGRAKNTLSGTQQTVATGLGIGANLPNANNSYFVQNGETLGNVSGSNTKTIERNQLPNFTLGGSTNTAGEHSHGHNAGGGNGGWGLIQRSGGGSNTSDGNTDQTIGEPNLHVFPIGLTINNAGNHSHTITTNSINGGVTQQSLNIQPQSLSLNAFIYLGQ